MNRQSMTILVASLLGALALPATAQQTSDTQVMTRSAPGHATIARKHKTVATVEAIDIAKREVTFKGMGDKPFSLNISPEVQNLEHVKVGDRVVVSYLEALSLTLKKDGKELRGSGEVAESAHAPAGDRPAGIAAEQVSVTADVIAIDKKTQMVKLRGPKQEVDLHVADPQQLKLIKVGDQIDALYTQALAVSVEPAAPAKK